MRSLSILGFVLIALGVGALLFGNFSYSDTKPILDAGPIHVKSEEQHDVNIPTIAGIAILVSGIALAIFGARAR
jgi:uncharacterized membrane protein